ncbi:MAG TPA: DUF4097 family beta strand repeat-containing protein [Longimicrobiales bacterium]|nr:DUF4097 family beta strand repeat-containing protein [Longimicrobiales bacterium]
MSTIHPTVLLMLFAAALPAELRGQVRERCAHEATRSATVRAPRGALLDLQAGAGALRVEGRAGLEEVRVRGRACAATEALLSELTIESDASDGRVRVRARYPESRNRDWNASYAYLDLVVEVPAGMAATIEDGSGSVVLDGLGALRVEDGSGDLTITNITGDVEVDDGSGDILVEGVTGGVRIDDGSGGMRIRQVRGDVTVKDGSGEIDISEVTGSVRVVDDGSGSIRVRDVGGDFVVDADGSGSIRHEGVRGRVQVPRQR